MNTPTIPERLDIKALCRAGEHFSGEIALAGMTRLCDEFGAQAGSANFDLQFHRDDNGVESASGQLRASVQATCNRCLDDCLVDVESTIQVCFIRDEAEATPEGSAAEPMLVGSTGIVLVQWMEDELLLALPLAPAHGQGQCAKALVQSDSQAQGGPFQALADLKEKLRNE